MGGCARWVRWLPMSPCAWSGVGPVTAMMLPLTVAGGCVVPGTVAGGCVVTGTVAGAAAAVVSTSAKAPASVAAVCSPGGWGGAAITCSPGVGGGATISWGPGAWGGAAISWDGVGRLDPDAALRQARSRDHWAAEASPTSGRPQGYPGYTTQAPLVDVAGCPPARDCHVCSALINSHEIGSHW